MISICLGQLCLWNGAGRMTKSAVACFGLPCMGVCVFLSVCVCWDNGIIEVLGVTGALMPGLLDWG